MELKNLEELFEYHDEAITEAQKDIQELMILLKEDWKKSRTRRGNISRNRSLRTNISLLMDRLTRLDTEIRQQAAEIVEHTRVRDFELQVKRKAEKEVQSDTSSFVEL